MSTVKDYELIKIPKDGKIVDRLQKQKIIYAARKGRTKQEVDAILNLEISYILSGIQGYEFDSVTPPVKNADQSYTFQLLFKKVENSPVKL